MKTSDLRWMLIQTVAFCGGAALSVFVQRDNGVEPTIGSALLYGVIAAFAVTALWIDARPRLIAFIKRRWSPQVLPDRDDDMGRIAFRLPAIEGDEGQSRRESERLAASTGSGSDSPKLTSGRRIS